MAEATVHYLYVALGLAVVVGVVALVLPGASPHLAPPHAGQLTITLPTEVWGLLFLSPVLAGFAVLVARRLLGPTWSFSRRTFVQLAVIVVLLLLFLYVLSHANSGPNGYVSVAGDTPLNVTSNNSTVHNNTTNSTPGHGNGGGSTPGAVPSPSSFAIPTWALLAVGVALTAVVAALALPGVLSGLQRRRPPVAGGAATDDDRARAQQAVTEAALAIDRGDDPRATIVRLYLRLLVDHSARLGDVVALTPEEIRARILAPLHVRPGAAEALTRLFEEARYSTHAMGADAAQRCRTALSAVELDLGASAPLP
ncbi:MAG TPA: DUF4129 domain-containing protein [Thermoplasmata archaeon]|nr:DUF4129 domain-containing protein [Thermoplasmata archaeon]